MDKVILYFGKNVRVACDKQCNKAWGCNSRPIVLQSETNQDDFVWGSDGELGTAPKNPGTYEGGEGKPEMPANWNKWCVRECERCAMSKDVNVAPTLRDFSKRTFNCPNSVFHEKAK